MADRVEIIATMAAADVEVREALATSKVLTEATPEERQRIRGSIKFEIDTDAGRMTYEVDYPPRLAALGIKANTERHGWTHVRTAPAADCWKTITFEAPYPPSRGQ